MPANLCDMDDLMVNGVINRNSSESVPIQNKECDNSLKASSSKKLDQHKMATPCSDDQHQSSSHIYNDRDEKSLYRVHSSHASASPRCMDESGIVVEELTLRNYTSGNIASVGTSTTRDRVQTRQNTWQHLYQIAGQEVSEHAHGKTAQTDKGRGTSTTWDDTGFAFFPGFLDQTHKSPSCGASVDSLPDTEGNFALNKEPFSNGGVRKKILSNSGFSEYFIKSSSEGKGIVCTGPAYQGPAHESNSQLQIKSTSVVMTKSDVRLTTATETIIAPLLESPETLHSLHPNSPNGESSLREWLNGGLNRLNKSECLLIFRQIVQIVDFSRSQGVKLQKLQPSCFKMSQSNPVIYIGPSVREDLKEDATIQGLSQSCINKRRPSEKKCHFLG